MSDIHNYIVMQENAELRSQLALRQACLEQATEDNAKLQQTIQRDRENADRLAEALEESIVHPLEGDGARWNGHNRKIHAALAQHAALRSYAAQLPTEQSGAILVDPDRQGGVPCIAGTRVPVHLVLWAIEHTGSIEGALKSYPDLTEQQVKDALYFAQVVVANSQPSRAGEQG